MTGCDGGDGADPAAPGAAAEQHQPRRPDQPHPSRLAPDHPRRDEILAAHRAAMADGQPGYLDPETGLFVLTAVYLAGRAECCHSGCRHCPYLGT
jgi:hypothetical protein